MALTVDDVEALTAKFDELEDALMAAGTPHGDKDEMSDDEMKKLARRAADDASNEKDKKAKSASRKAADEDMDDEYDDIDDDEDGDDNQIAKKSRRASRKGGKNAKDAKDAKIASLTAALSRATALITRERAAPMIQEMLSARASAGMPMEQVKELSASLGKLTLPEIQQRYREEQVLFAGHNDNNNNAAAASADDPFASAYQTMPFASAQPGLSASSAASPTTSSQTLEEMFK